MSPRMKQAAYIQKTELPFISFSLKWVSWLLPIIVVGIIVFNMKDYLSDPQTLPVNKIRVHGVFINIDEPMLHSVITSVVAGGYFNVDVERVREVVEQLAWVSKASVRRVWPDTLSVSIVEQKPVAISKNHGLINAQGDVFKPLNTVLPGTLPVFEGKVSLSKMMLLKYDEMNVLLTTVDRKITYLKIDARHSIEIKLDNGLKIMVGRGDAMHRLERLTKIYQNLFSAHIDNIDVIDLRYTNGMAISWKNKAKEYKKILGDMMHV